MDIPTNTNAGMGMERDVPGWTPEIWTDIDKAVTEEMKRVRIAQRVFPVEEIMDDDHIPNDVINFSGKFPLSMPERQRIDFVEVSVEFSLTQKQVMSEAKSKTAMKLARLAANRLAQAEDRILFLGRAALPGLESFGATVTTESFVQNGLLFENPAPPVLVDPNEGSGKFPESIFGAVTAGNARLHADGQNEPLGCVLHFTHFGNAHAPTAQSLVMPADRILGVIREDETGKGGFHPSEALSVSRGSIFEQVTARAVELKSEDLKNGDSGLSKEFKSYLAAEEKAIGTQETGGQDQATSAKDQAAGDEVILCGLLAAQAGQPTKIYIAKHAIAEKNQKSADGKTWTFRVTEMIQYRSHDPRSLLRIEFRPDDAAPTK